MFDHLLESSRWDDSNKWSKIGFDEEIGILENKNDRYLVPWKLTYNEMLGTIAISV